MNKFICKSLFGFFIFSFCFLHAEMQNTLEIRAGAFFHSSHRFKEVYGRVGTSFQVEAASRVYECLDAWTNFDYFRRERRPGDCGKTRVLLLNLSFGLKYVYPLWECLDVYVGIGPSFTRVNLKNRYCCFHEEHSKIAYGGLIKTGIYYPLNSFAFIDLFVDYLYQPVRFHRHIDVGGFKIGGGLGIKF